MRAPRFDNLLKSWSIPGANNGKPFMSFPEVELNGEKEKRIAWWNATIAARTGDSNLKLVAGAEIDIILNNRPGWFGF